LAAKLQAYFFRSLLDARLEVQRLDPPFLPAATDHLATILESLTRRRQATVSFGTEAAHFGSLTAEAVVFGPGKAHKTGEFVPTSELSACTLHLDGIIQKLCAK
jgi:acetylornithine deacetylase/succinyl-diaminopimelate desuccinylase-like protein